MKLFQRIALTSAVVLALASCGGGGGGSSKVALLGENVATGLVPDPNGFAFANFASSASPEVFNAEDIVKMFGSTKDVCVEGSNPCQLVAEAAAWARMVNDARASGHCEGFAVTSASRFTSSENPTTAELDNKGDVTHAIMRAFATQFLKEVQDDTKAWAKKSLKEKVAALETSFTNKSVAYSLGVYTDTGGHAVLPYALEYVTPTKVKIKVYDSNWPGKDRYVSVDLDSNTWSFSFSGQDPANDPDMWSGGSKDLDLTSMTSRTGGSCPFCAGKSGVNSTMLLVRSTALDWSVKTSQGTISPESPESGDAEARPLRSSSGDAPRDFIVSIPAGEEISLSLPSMSRVTGVTPTAAIQIDTPGSDNSVVEISDSSVSSNDPAVVLTLADGNLVGTSNGESNSITTTGEQLEVVTTSANGEDVKVNVTEEAPAIEVRTNGQPDMAKGSDVEILTQVGPNSIEKETTDSSGSKKTSTQKGQLDNTKESVPLPDELQAPDVKDGLPQPEDRQLGNGNQRQSPVNSSNSTNTSGSGSLPKLREVAGPPS